jgi:hypothetical protein
LFQKRDKFTKNQINQKRRRKNQVNQMILIYWILVKKELMAVQKKLLVYKLKKCMNNKIRIKITLIL